MSIRGAQLLAPAGLWKLKHTGFEHKVGQTLNMHAEPMGHSHTTGVFATL